MFIWMGKEIATYGDLIAAVSLIVDGGDEQEAQAFTDAYIAADGEAVARSNIGFTMGEFDPAKMQAGLALFKARHPVFGGSAPTPEAAFQAGQEAGQRMRPGGGA